MASNSKPKDNFGRVWGYLKQVLPLDAFEACLHGSIFDDTAFCCGGKQYMLLNGECSLWYNRVGDFFSVSLG